MILFALFGMPPARRGDDFAAFHEAGADLVSLISFLHFDSGLDRLLRRTQGNLLTRNELNRIAELESERQMRIASNPRRMSEITADIHDRARPFIGAVFDTLIELYHHALIEDDLADPELLEHDLRAFDEPLLEQVGARISAAYGRRPGRFKSALMQARDSVGLTLAESWTELEPDGLSFAQAAETVIDCAYAVAGPAAGALFEENFHWREIL